MTPDLVEVEGLRKYFPVKGSNRKVHAVEDVSLRLRHGETLGVVGESGCGKSTLGRLILRLLTPTEGRIRVDGVDVSALSPRRLRAARRDMQLIFQDVYAFLDKRQKVGSIIADPKHPYTRALLAAIPRPHVRRRRGERPLLHGEPPNPETPPSGCRFHPRCPEAMDVCQSDQPVDYSVGGGGRFHGVRCHLYG